MVFKWILRKIYDKKIKMFLNYSAVKQTNPTSTVQAYQFKDWAQAIMGFIMLPPKIVNVAKEK